MRMESRPAARGFSLIELMFGMTITLGMGLVVFQMFIQNQQVFSDQNLILEMQQSARAIASMISDELRMAGQGVPIYAASQDDSGIEEAQTFLDGTDTGTLRFRGGVRNAFSAVTTPLVYTASTAVLVTVADVSAINTIVGANSNRFVYLWGPTTTGWSWLRAQIATSPAIDTANDQLTITPWQLSGAGGTFSSPPKLSLEEGISYRLSSGSVLRGTTTNFSNTTTPTFTESTVGDNFTTLSFAYYDSSGTAVTPSTLAIRNTVRRVDVTVAAQTSEALASTGATRSYAVTLSVYPRNLSIN